jgi:NadR type nicotinamide-nucleotide adenylyltransferase
MSLGLVVGKFYPPHKGHKHLIDTARAQVDRLIVLVLHHVSHKIPGELRRDWVAHIHPDCEVCLVADTLDNDSKQWADWTLAYLSRAPDVVFSSEDYGDDYAAFMGCRHVSVDRRRLTVPTSGTAIRRQPLEHLDFLEPCVRAYFVRRVVLVGAESTGKTTLAAELADHFGTAWVPEYGREYWERKVAGLSMDGPLPGWTSDEFVHIAAEQQRRENLAARSARKVLIADTNAFATGIWHERYLGYRDRAVDAVGASDKVDLYLLTEPDFPFVQDGLRDGVDIRHGMHQRFVQVLARTGVRTVRVAGSRDRRRAAAIEEVDTLLRAPFDL